MMYEWKMLTEDGLLKSPSNVGAYYDSTNVNRRGPWATPEEAMKAFDEFDAIWKTYESLVLVGFYRPPIH